MTPEWIVLVDGRMEVDPRDHRGAEHYARAARRVQPGAQVEVITLEEGLRRKYGR